MIEKMLFKPNSSNYIVLIFVPGMQKGIGKQFSDEFEAGLYNKKKHTHTQTHPCTHANT